MQPTELKKKKNIYIRQVIIIILIIIIIKACQQHRFLVLFLSLPMCSCMLLLLVGLPFLSAKEFLIMAVRWRRDTMSPSAS